jgi:hypothetical protein
MDLGLYRVACRNGLVVGHSIGTSVRLTHTGDQRQNVLNAARHVLESVPKLLDAVATWGRRQLSSHELAEFNSRAFALRGGDPDDVPTLFAAPRRQEDVKDSLWLAFNRAQESLMRGGFRVRTNRGTLRAARGIRAVRPTIQINKALWDLAEEFLPA